MSNNSKSNLKKTKKNHHKLKNKKIFYNRRRKITDKDAGAGAGAGAQVEEKLRTENYK